MAFELTKLPYSYDALEPHIDARTMEIHHSKHHQAYTNNFNAALEGHADLLSKSAVEILTDLKNVPADIQTAVRNNGGGYYNHDLFWKVMGGSFRSRQNTSRVTKGRPFGSVLPPLLNPQ